MTFGRALNIFAAVLLLGSICTGLLSGRCALPRAGRPGVTVMSTASHPGDADPCALGCLPDCYACSRSEAAVVIQVALEPQVSAASFLASETRASDGVTALPYHPPLSLL